MGQLKSSGMMERIGLVFLGIVAASAVWGTGPRVATGDTARPSVQQDAKPASADLTSSDRETRRRAVEELGRSADERNVGPLSEVLRNDRDFLVRSAAADALGSLRSKQGVAPLIAALRDSNAEVRTSSALALARLNDPSAVSALRPLLKDAEALVRSAAAQALGKLNAGDALPELTALLADPEPEVRTGAAEALGALASPRAVDSLITALADKNLYVRSRSATALGKIGDARAVPPIVELLKDADRTVRASAADALGKFRDRRAVQPLMDALRDRDAFVRQNAAFALGKIGDESAADALADCLRDEDGRVRGRAVDALGVLAVPRTVETVSDALRDSDSLVRTQAAQALGNYKEERAVDALVQTLSEADPILRRRAIESLGKIGENKALPALQSAIADANPTVRASAVAAFARVGKAGAVPTLIETLKSDDAQTRNAAAFALGQMKSNDVFSAVLKFIGGLDAGKVVERRQTLAGFFTAFGDTAQALTAARAATDASERRGALYAGTFVLNAPEAETWLKSALADTAPEVRRAALESLARRNPAGFGTEAARLLASDRDAGVRRYAAELLGTLQPGSGGEFGDALRAALRRDGVEEVRVAAGNALDRLGLARIALPTSSGGGGEVAVNTPTPGRGGSLRIDRETAPRPTAPARTRPRETRPVQPVEQPADDVTSPTPTTPGTTTAATSTTRRPVKPTRQPVPTAEPDEPAETPTVARVEPQPRRTTPRGTSSGRSKPTAAAPDAVRAGSTGRSPVFLMYSTLPPSFGPTRAAAMETNETAIQEKLAALARAEFTFRLGNPNRFASLDELLARKLADAALGSGLADGYRFSLYITNATASAPANFFIVAIPVTFGETGRKSFYIDATGIVRARETSQPTEPEFGFLAWQAVQ